MNASNQDRRVQFVLDAFDTLFNKRDYAAAERLWSPRYIQHSAHIAPGRDGLFDLVKGLPRRFPISARDRRSPSVAQATLDLISKNSILGHKILVAQQQLFVDRPGDVRQHGLPVHRHSFR